MKETDFHFQNVLVYVTYNQAGLDHAVSLIIFWIKIEFYWSESETFIRTNYKLWERDRKSVV